MEEWISLLEYHTERPRLPGHYPTKGSPSIRLFDYIGSLTISSQRNVGS